MKYAIHWSSKLPTDVPRGDCIYQVSDSVVTMYGFAARGRTLLGIGRAFADGFDHNGATGIVTVEIRRFARGQAVYMGRVQFGPDNVASVVQ
jgi:hypothetical protein